MKAVIIYSGGMDSYTLLADLRHQGYNDIHALSFFYGQRHGKELDCAQRVCKAWGVQHKIVDIQDIGALLKGSALTYDVDVPEGHYTEPTMKQTVVPNRNMIMLSVAVGHAVSIGVDKVFTAVHAGDHAIYPDCRPEFIAALNQVTSIANYQPVTVGAPYLFLSKGQILEIGLGLPDTDYADTWTCYKGQNLACGKCGACVERLEAFVQNHLPDPLEYAA